MKLGKQVGLGPGHIALGGYPAPLPQRAQPHTIFGPYLLRPNGCMDQDATWYGVMPQPWRLCVRWGPRSTLPKKGAEPLHNFRPISIVAKRLHASITTWYGGRPQPRGLCVRWGHSPLNFRPMFIIVILISLEHCTMHSRYWFVQVQVRVLVFYAFYFSKKFNRRLLSLFRYTQLHHIAPIAEVGVAN